MSRLEITKDTTISEVTGNGCDECPKKSRGCVSGQAPKNPSASNNAGFAAAQVQAGYDMISWVYTKGFGGERMCWLNDDKDNAFLINPLAGADYELRDVVSGEYVDTFETVGDCLQAAKEILVDRRALSKISVGIKAQEVQAAQEQIARSDGWIAEQKARNRPIVEAVTEEVQEQREIAMSPQPTTTLIRPKDDLTPHSKADTVNPKDLQGIKKPPVELVPDSATILTAMAFKDGAAKYGAYNWRVKPVKASIYVAAAKRHLAAWYNGEENAEDSGVHHLGHALACLSILVDAQVGGNLVDDRPTPIDIGALIDSLKVED